MSVMMTINIAIKPVATNYNFQLKFNLGSLSRSFWGKFFQYIDV